LLVLQRPDNEMRRSRECNWRAYHFELHLRLYSVSALEAAFVAATPVLIPDIILSEVVFEIWTRDCHNIQSNHRAIPRKVLESERGGNTPRRTRESLCQDDAALILICSIGSGRLADKGENPGLGAENVAGCISVTIHMCFCKVHNRDPGVQLCGEIQAIQSNYCCPRRLVCKVRTPVATPRPNKVRAGFLTEDD
jgi:hypothetical protein